jgi:hypothetical protein
VKVGKSTDAGTRETRAQNMALEPSSLAITAQQEARAGRARQGREGLKVTPSILGS